MRLLLGIGAMRAGTTTLHHQLERHPQVAVGRGKELHYFDRHHDRGLAWYHAQFDVGAATTVRADVTPNYLYDPAAPTRARAYGDDVRAVAILRDPVERAYSHYLQKRSYGTEPLAFADAIDAEPARLARSPVDRAVHSYVDRGRYLGQLQRWASAIGRENLHVALLDDLAARTSADPAPHWAAIFELAGVAPIDDGVPPRANHYVELRVPALRPLVRRLPGPARRAGGRLNTRRVDAPPMAEADVRRLRAELAGEVDRLSAWLGRDLAALWWDDVS